MSTTPHRSNLKLSPRYTPSPAQEAYDAFLLSLRAAHRSRRTLEFYGEKLGPFVRWLQSQDITELKHITPSHIRRFLLDQEEAGRAPRTVHHYAATIKAWLNWCVSEELLADSPMRKVKMPKVEDRILPAFSAEDVDALLKATDDPRDTALIMCLLDTGARASEFCALNCGDVDMKTGQVQIAVGKNRKGRVVFLGAKARVALSRYLRQRTDVSPDAPLWVRKTLDHRLDIVRMTRENLHESVRRVGERAQVEHCHPHTFRRSFALWSLRSGMSIYALRQLMGHGDLQVLQRYLALVEQDLAQAHAQHGPVDSLTKGYRR